MVQTISIVRTTGLGTSVAASALLTGLCSCEFSDIATGRADGSNGNPAAEEADADIRPFIRQLLVGWNAEGDRTLRVTAAPADLNGDGRAEIIAYLEGDSVCGSGGCDTYIVAQEEEGYRVLTKLTISWPPIRILERKTSGWHNLGVWTQGGGIQPGFEAELKFDGQSYPANPSLAEPSGNPPASGRVIIPGKPIGLPVYQ